MSQFSPQCPPWGSRHLASLFLWIFKNTSISSLAISFCIIMAITNRVMRLNSLTLLKENGGSLELMEDWVWELHQKEYSYNFFVKNVKNTELFSTKTCLSVVMYMLACTCHSINCLLDSTIRRMYTWQNLLMVYSDQVPST